MKNKKYILAIIMSLVLLMTCACGDNTTNTESTPTQAPEVTPAPTAAPSAPVLYQVSPDTSTLMNCYVIKTRNNKYIVIDGGGVGTRENNSGYLYSYLQELTGQQVPEIEAWFLSHLHDDHVTEFTLIGTDPSKEIKINNVYFNLPSRAFMQRMENGKFTYLFDDVKQSYDRFFGEGAFDKTNGKNVFTDDVFEIDGIKVEILCTVSDSEGETNINDTSLIFRLTIEGQTVLFLGDAAVAEGGRLLSLCAKTIQSDIVQMAHHGQGGVAERVYVKINPKMCLWPTPDWVFDNTSGTLQTLVVRQWMIDLGVEYHLITGRYKTQSIEFPVNFDALTKEDITPGK